MAVRLDAAQEVKKSLRTPRGGQDEGAATSLGASLSAWFLRPTPRWVLGAAAVALIAAFGLWQWRHNLDTTPKRWSEEKETSSAYFNTLTTPSASSRDQCFHSEDEKIASRPWDWTRPSVAVYSTAAPPHALSTLRDLGDQGQAEAIRFLEKDPSQKGAWANLQESLDDAKSTVGEHDPFRFERVLVANVEQGVDWAPGDRMVWTRVLVEPINFAFAGYSVALTDNEIQNVSSVERTDSRKFSADLSTTIPGGMEGPKASLGPSSEHSVRQTPRSTRNMRSSASTSCLAFSGSCGKAKSEGRGRQNESVPDRGDQSGNDLETISERSGPRSVGRRSNRPARQRNPF